MNSIPAQEIKRRGITAVDAMINSAPVHVIKNNVPCYVIMTQERYKTLLEIEETAYLERLRLSLQDVEGGNVYSFKSADELLKMIDE